MDSCIGCKFLYLQDDGYSNYTVLDTEVRCAKDKNPNLPASDPHDWNRREVYDKGLIEDNWSATQNSRCELYAKLPAKENWPVHLDCDNVFTVSDFTSDEEVITVILLHKNMQHGDEDND